MSTGQLLPALFAQSLLSTPFLCVPSFTYCVRVLCLYNSGLCGGRLRGDRSAIECALEKKALGTDVVSSRRMASTDRTLSRPGRREKVEPKYRPSSSLYTGSIRRDSPAIIDWLEKLSWRPATSSISFE